MNGQLRQARRYHWLSEGLKSFVDEPHAAIEGPGQGEIVNLTDHRAETSRGRQLERCRRQFRDSQPALCRVWAGVMGVAPARPSGQIHIDPLGSIPARFPGPRSVDPRGMVEAEAEGFVKASGRRNGRFLRHIRHDYL